MAIFHSTALDAIKYTIFCPFFHQILDSLRSCGEGLALGRSVAQCLAYLAVIEIPRGEWNELIPLLAQNVECPTLSNVHKQASLETIGYFCQEAVRFWLLIGHTNDWLIDWWITHLLILRLIDWLIFFIGNFFAFNTRILKLRTEKFQGWIVFCFRPSTLSTVFWTRSTELSSVDYGKISRGT